MKTLPKIPQILVILLILAQTALAQEQEQKTDEGIKLGVRGGVQITAMGPLDWSFGWHAGVVRDVVKLTNFELLGGVYNIYIQPGLYFSTRESIWNKSTYWLEIPVQLSFKHQPKTAPGIFSKAYRFELGPYMNIGVLGDYSDVLTNLAGDQEEDQMSRFDVGITFTAGYEFGIVWVYSSYSLGFINVSDYYDSSTYCWKIIGIGLNF